MITDQQHINRLALSMLKGIGPVIARDLVAYCGGVDVLFEDRKIGKLLAKVPRVGEKLTAILKDRTVLDRARTELEYIRKHEIRAMFFLDEAYPRRLKHCEDAPVMLFFKGSAELDPPRSVAIVGTRRPTPEGKRACEELVEGLMPTGALIVSGLAYGIDIVAHRTANKHGMTTVAAVAHGLDRLYPGEHRSTAEEMQKNGGLICELPSGSNFAPGNFPARNRIIAGLTDLTVVVESGPKGGSLITADIADSYHRDVFAYPGRYNDERSIGCNRLIQRNRAALATSAEDIIRAMGWKDADRPKATQASLFVDLAPEERSLVEVLRAGGDLAIDELCLRSNIPQSKAASLLLNLEFSGVVRSLPGKVYALN